MANIKKLKENGSTIYPATIPEGVVDTNGFTLAEFMDELLSVLGGSERNETLIALSDLRAAIGSEDGNDLSRFVSKVNAFLNDADASDTTINRWKEIESFLTGITDTKTLTGLLNDTLTSAKSYADTKVQQGTANAVTMSANAAASDRVLTSAGTNKTAKDSGVAIGDLAQKDLSNVTTDTIYGKGTSAGFIPFDLIEATYGGDSALTFSTAVADVRNALQGFGDGERGVLLHMKGDESGDSAIILNSLKITNGFAIWFLGTDDILHYAEVNTSGSSATVSNHKVYEFSKFLQSIPVATSAILGGVRVGSGLTTNEAGILSVTSAPKATNDSDGNPINTTYLKAAAVTDVTDYPEITI